MRGRALAAITIFPLSTAVAQVSLDGSFGTAGPLPGPDVVISEDLGRQVGGNLFHSFDTFSIGAGESATFTGPASVDNVIGRVTGGNASIIDGTLGSTIPDANLFLSNPAGVVFGPDASLNVQGSFHATTADYIGLTDGARFNAAPSLDDALLSAAPVAAFGFAQDNPARISVNGSLLRVPDGQDLSVVGGDIVLDDGRLLARSGHVRVASVASAGEAVLDPSGLNVSEIEALGSIRISTTSPLDVDDRRAGNIDAAGSDANETASGNISIRGGRFVSDNGFINANSLRNSRNDGGRTDISIRGEIELGGITLIQSDGLSLEEGGARAGDAGDVFVSASRLRMRGNSFVQATTIGDGDAGDIVMSVGELSMMDGSGIVSQSRGAGNGGNVSINADEISMSNNAAVRVQVTRAGDAGNISVTASSISLQDNATFDASVFRDQPGAGGQITVRGGSLSIADSQASIAVNTFGSGAGGDVDIQVDRLTLTDRARIESSGASTGTAGDLQINAQQLTLSSGAKIDSSTSGSGAGGDIIINARSASLDGLAAIGAESTGTGEAGGITLRAADSVKLENSEITTAATRPDGGDIEVRANNRVELTDSRITTSVAGGEGDGGNITVGGTVDATTPEFVILQRSDVIANAFGGRGGNINIRTGNFLSSPDSIVSASSAQSIDGMVAIDSPDTDIGSNVAVLPESFLDATSLLRDPCAVRTATSTSSLVVAGQTGTTLDPAGYLPSFAAGHNTEESNANRSGASGTYEFLSSRCDPNRR